MNTNATVITIADSENTEHESTHSMLNTTAAPNVDIFERLRFIVQEGDLEKLYGLLLEQRNVLEAFDRDRACDTPLHEVARSGHTHMAMELINMKPAFMWKLNELSLTPMHLALQNNFIETARAMMDMDGDVINIRGRGLITPLHQVAAMTGNEDLLSEFLVACPASIEGRTIRRETALHVAVNHANLQSFKVLLGWLRRVNKEEILNWKDEAGNTVLHIATSTNQTEVIKLIHKIVNVNAKNSLGKTAKDIFLDRQASLDPEIGKILGVAKAKSGYELTGTSLANYLSQSLSVMEIRNKMLGLDNLSWNIGKRSPNTSDLRNSMLVVAILIMTATYQAILCPPGGYWQDTTLYDKSIVLEDRHEAGRMVISPLAAMFFYSLNGIAFFSSMWVMMMLIIGLPMWMIIYGSVLVLGVASYACFACTFPFGTDGELMNSLLSFSYPIAAGLIALMPYIAFVRNERRRRRVDFHARYFSLPVGLMW